jgi:hypothetical protein
MIKSNWKWAFLLLIGLASIISNAAAQDAAPQSVTPRSEGCTPVLQQPVAPGDTIDLKGPDVPANQQALGINWDYSWTVRKDDVSGEVVATFETQSISFAVPTSDYAPNYYIEMMVTAREASTCINQACMTFPIVTPGQCSITTDADDQICITDSDEYEYSTADTPSQVNQRWWVFKQGEVPASIQYNGNANSRVGDGSSINIAWNGIAEQSGTYVVLTGYFGKKSPFALQGSCQKQVVIVDVPLNTITVT